jgi:ferredoxin-NADP reductase
MTISTTHDLVRQSESIAEGRTDLVLHVTSRVIEAEGVVSLELSDPSGDELPEWQPGAHIDLEVGADRLIRSYSLCGDPSERSVYKIAVLRETDGRGGSIAVHEELHESSSVRMVGLRNHFAVESAESYVFVAGGIGVTPLLPMIAEAERSGKPWQLHYAGSSTGSMAFAGQLVDSYGDHVTLYPKSEGTRLDLERALAMAPSGAGVYCCGPARLLSAFEDACAQRGLKARIERFEADQAAIAERSDDSPFEVYFAQTDVTITVNPGESILDLAEQAGADVFGSCLEGICGTCETRVIEGTPDHRDSVLSGSPTNTMMICVSRAACPRLILDA